MRLLGLCVTLCSLLACSADTEAPSAGGDASVPTDAKTDTRVDARDTSTGTITCADLDLVASGTTCPSTGCAAINCPCPEGFPRSFTSCTKDGCLVQADCSAVCAMKSLGDVLACDDTYTIKGVDSGGTMDTSTPDTPCLPKTCGALGKNCGTVSDGCGKMIDCGICTGLQTCGGGGTPNVCGCTPKSCAALGAECGAIDNGCGTTITCPSCASPKWCGGAGTANKCGCVPSGVASKNGAIASNVAIGTTGAGTWTTPEGALTADSKNAYIAGFSTSESPSDYLIVRNFGLDVPSFATITGIEVTIVRYAGQPNAVADHQVRLVKAASVTATDRSKAGNWPTSKSSSIYGGSADLWGNTWTPAEVNSPEFGVALSAKYVFGAGNSWTYVDHIAVKVHFTVAGCI